ncbi:MAG: MetQ/NlpA family ABC transporter substrate-binding protein, partial [Oscillospiraceae bacterium]|nr:MetQ/NlpA family ABC transporter substrate-binding protein [Oscillospiraceae bacterium]
MKKIIALILTLAAVFSLAACGSSSAPAAATEAPAAAEATEAPAAEPVEITVGATAVPHAEILEQVKDALAAEGYTLNIVIYDDYVLPNQALAEGTLDANYFQHRPYLNSYNESNGTDLVSAAVIHYEPFGIYGNGVASISEVPEGATIIIPADDSNGTRALLLLQQEGLIELPEDASLEKGVTVLDIVDDHGYNVQAVQADTVPAQLKNSDEGTIAVINGN